MLGVSLVSCNGTGGSSPATSPQNPSSPSTSSPISSSTVQHKDFLEVYKNGFNAETTLVSRVENANDVTAYMKSFHGSDFFTAYYLGQDKVLSGAYFYEAGDDGALIEKTLDKKNTIVSEAVLGETFADSDFSILLDDFEVALNADGQADVDSAKMNIAQKFNYQLTAEITGTLVPDSAYFTVGEDSLSYHSVIVNGTSSLIIDSVLTPLTEERLSTFASSDNAIKFNNILTSLKGNNYTATVKRIDEVVEVVYLKGTDLYIDEKGSSNYGYYATDAGYQAVKVNTETSKVTLDSPSTNKFSTLIADFDVAGEIFEGEAGALKPSALVDGNADQSFVTKGLEDFIGSNSTFSIENDVLRIDTSIDGVAYSVTFSDIGSTVLPLDIHDVTTEKTWADEEVDYNFAEVMEIIFGPDFKLPYFDTGYAWTYIDYFEDEDYIDMSCEDVPESEVAGLIASYTQILKNAGFTELSADEIDALGIYAVGGGNVDYFYDLGNGYIAEVYDAYETGYLNGIGLYIHTKPAE